MLLPCLGFLQAHVFYSLCNCWQSLSFSLQRPLGHSVRRRFRQPFRPDFHFVTYTTSGWARVDLNHRPSSRQDAALPDCATRPCFSIISHLAGNYLRARRFQHQTRLVFWPIVDRAIKVAALSRSQGSAPLSGQQYYTIGCQGVNTDSRIVLSPAVGELAAQPNTENCPGHKERKANLEHGFLLLAQQVF